MEGWKNLGGNLFSDQPTTDSDPESAPKSGTYPF